MLWSGEGSAHQGGHAHHGHAPVRVLARLGRHCRHHIPLRLHTRHCSWCGPLVAHVHHSPSAGAYVVFAVSPVSLTIITVGVYTLSVITLVFFVYSVANRSNFGRCSSPCQLCHLRLTPCAAASVFLSSSFSVRPRAPLLLLSPCHVILTPAPGIVLYSTVRDSFADAGAMKVRAAALKQPQNCNKL